MCAVPTILGCSINFCGGDCSCAVAVGGGFRATMLVRHKRSVRASILFDAAFVNIGNFCNLYFFFYKEENHEVGAIFCLLLLLLSQKHPTAECTVCCTCFFA